MFREKASPGLEVSGLLILMWKNNLSGPTLKDFKILQKKKGSRFIFLQEFEKLKNELLSDDSYIPVQKSRKKNVPLIDWEYLLGIIILALSAEWFLRKYYGLYLTSYI